jgi:hypothetical protein
MDYENIFKDIKRKQELFTKAIRTDFSNLAGSYQKSQ